MSVRLVVAAIAAVTWPTALRGQDRAPIEQESLIERAALQAALAKAGLSERGLRVVVDPSMVRPDEAPGSNPIGMRSINRNDFLLRSFAATLLPSSGVIDCVKGNCELRNADVVITLSNPQVVGDEATITVTTEQVIHRRRHYITNRFRLSRVGVTWKVVSAEQLGIS